MKYKTTRKTIKERYDKIIEIGFCNAQYLLKYETPFAYSTRIEGWACDYYNIGGVCVSTGYAPIGNKIDYEILKGYEQRARDIILNINLDTETKKQKVNELLNKLIAYK